MICACNINACRRDSRSWGLSSRGDSVEDVGCDIAMGGGEGGEGGGEGDGAPPVGSSPTPKPFAPSTSPSAGGGDQSFTALGLLWPPSVPDGRRWVAMLLVPLMVWLSPKEGLLRRGVDEGIKDLRMLRSMRPALVQDGPTSSSSSSASLVRVTQASKLKPGGPSAPSCSSMTKILFIPCMNSSKGKSLARLPNGRSISNAR
mmetsp:Transcript_69340/g.201112  ORF Transcript_69340/g.201112 Transcript_69340/m.201112 type:complete len:202 (+) Transcript_69340:567-1172(+)